MIVLIRHGYDQNDESIDEKVKFKTIGQLKNFIIEHGGKLFYSYEEEDFIMVLKNT